MGFWGTGEGVIRLKERLSEASQPQKKFFHSKDGETFREWVSKVSADRAKGNSPDLDIARETTERLKMLRGLVSSAESQIGTPEPNKGFGLDKIALHPVWGYFLMLAILLVVFEGVFTLSSYPVELLDTGIDKLSGILSNFLPAGPVCAFVWRCTRP